MSKQQLRVAIVGGIAVGKSTIINMLLKSLEDCIFIEEDVNENLFLSDFYEDMNKWAFHSRISTFSMILNNYSKIIKNNNSKVVIFDRCVDELITFAKLQYDLGNLTTKEFMVYKTLYRGVLDFTPPIDLFIYVHCDAEKSLQRIKKRNRSFEQDITIDYLELLNKNYNNWVSSIPTDKVLFVSTNNDMVEIDKIIHNIKKRTSNNEN